MNLKDFSTATLEQELERRRRALAEEMPKPLPNPNFSKLAALIKQTFEAAVEEGSLDEDIHNIVYGDGFWKWRNRQSW